MFVGLFGGTFDPVHNGHIQAANSARRILKLDKVIMIPAGDPYLKRTELVASPKERYHMVSLAIQKIPFLEVSDIEIFRSGPSYTLDTVRELKRNGHEVIVLLGTDSIIEMDKWEDPDSLHSECEVVGLTRPGFQIDKSKPYQSRQRKYSLRTIEVNSPAISSTKVRNLIQNGQDVTELVPQGVNEYIQKEKLYHLLA
ncbi:MAG: nicotinate-nucleotide adenylyltransferase [Chloroflexota bacterium]|nr:nicotinic acid mononucleotide adenylyltransferase [Chloroflexota bacterium]MEC7913841.1 nicotinate-nucleotide adenylyltransferase [Chloroflexota bacterium]HBR65693.1 nicotinic acid mononucleotide adenylyltransferase [Dehalococcoidia bacterium]